MASLNKKTSRMRDCYQDFIMHRFLQLLKDVPLDRLVTDGYSEAMCSLADIIFDSFKNHDDVEVELFEKRWPQLWFRISDKSLPSDKQVILVMYGYSYSEKTDTIAMLVMDGDDAKAVSGDAKQISNHLKNFIAGKPVPFNNYRIKPYTKFLATLEPTIGFDVIDRITDLARKTAEERIGDYLKQPLTDVQNKKLSEFTQWLSDRCYYSIMSSIQQCSSEFTFCFRTYKEVKLVFNCDDAGESGLKSTLFIPDGNEIIIKTVDDARTLESYINEKTGLANDKEVFQKLIGE